MTPHRISVKLFLEDPSAADLAALVPVFHRWIRDKRLEGLLIDVADYKHVPDGPGVLIVGHEADYGLDEQGGRVGLLAVSKRLADGDLKSNLTTTVRRALAAVDALESEKLSKPLKFDRTELEIKFQDRLRIENSEAGFNAVKADVEAALGGAAKLSRTSDDPRQPLTLLATLGAAVSV